MKEGQASCQDVGSSRGTVACSQKSQLSAEAKCVNMCVHALYAFVCKCPCADCFVLSEHTSFQSSHFVDCRKLFPNIKEISDSYCSSAFIHKLTHSIYNTIQKLTSCITSCVGMDACFLCMFVQVGPAVSSHTLHTRPARTQTTLLLIQEELEGYPQRSSVLLWQLIVPDNQCAA